MSEIQKQELASLNIKEHQLQNLKQIFPEVFTEGNNIDWEKLKLTLGENVDVGKERYGMNWPGKADCFKTIQQPSIATLVPDREESVNFDTTENLFIEGDNLEVLKLLQKSYLGKIKMIYIDPPYNTGKEFIYPDNYTESLETYLEYSGQKGEDGKKYQANTDTDGRYHSKWLNMMYPRLFIAKNLLREDGFIFISIDDNEISNLKSVCDEIFGEENFVALLSVENNPKGRKNSKFISVSNDYCIIYAKQSGHPNSLFVESIPKNIKDLSLDENGNFVHNSGKRILVGENEFNKPVNNFNSEKHYTVYHNKTKNVIKIVKEKDINSPMLVEDYDRYFSFNDNVFVENTYTEKKLLELFDNNALEFKNGKIYEKNLSTSIRLKSLLINRKYDAVKNGILVKEYELDYKTTSAGTKLKELFSTNDLIFNAPKSVGLIKNLMELLAPPNDDFLILDFFAGSGTTAHAVLDLNKEDGGSRKFICVQLPEPTDEKSEAYKANFKNIADISKERIRRASSKILNELQTEKSVKENNPTIFDNLEPTTNNEQPTTKEQDLGFKVFKLQPSNFKIWDGTIEKNPEAIQAKLFEHIDHIPHEENQEAILYELLLKSGFELTTPIEKIEIAGKKVFSIAEGMLLICLEKNMTLDCLKEMAEMQPTRVICLDEAFEGENADALKTNAVQIMKSKGVLNFRTV